MNQYIDRRGVDYTLQAGFTGSPSDIVILGAGGKAWRINKDVLVRSSPIFQYLANAAPSSEVYLYRASQPTLHVYLLSITHRVLPTIPFIETQRLVTLFANPQGLHSPDAARSVLYQGCHELHGKDLFEAFVLASSLGCVSSSCRILLQGYKWYTENTGDSLSLLPSCEYLPWSAADAARITPAWLWALSQAERKMRRKGFRPGRRGGSCQLVGLFMRYLTQ